MKNDTKLLSRVKGIIVTKIKSISQIIRNVSSYINKSCDYYLNMVSKNLIEVFKDSKQFLKSQIKADGDSFYSINPSMEGYCFDCVFMSKLVETKWFKFYLDNGCYEYNEILTILKECCQIEIKSLENRLSLNIFTFMLSIFNGAFAVFIGNDVTRLMETIEKIENVSIQKSEHFIRLELFVTPLVGIITVLLGFLVIWVTVYYINLDRKVKKFRHIERILSNYSSNGNKRCCGKQCNLIKRVD